MTTNDELRALAEAWLREWIEQAWGSIRDIEIEEHIRTVLDALTAERERADAAMAEVTQCERALASVVTERDVAQAQLADSDAEVARLRDALSAARAWVARSQPGTIVVNGYARQDTMLEVIDAALAQAEGGAA